MLVDRFGRKIDSFRIAVTSRCNYQCIFCHREGMMNDQGNEALDAGDYGFLTEVAVKHGIKSFKLTGGEPLVRSDIVDIVREIAIYTRDVSMTTNGSLLLEKVGLLAEAGLNRINVSIHSLKPPVYRFITGGSTLLEKVLKGVDEALNHGIKVKIDFLVMKVNIDEVKNIIEYASDKGLDVNIIELIPLGIPQDVYRDQHVIVDPIIEFLEKNSIAKTVREFQSRPEYIMPSGIKVDVVKGYGNPALCSRCTRLRLTPEGWIKTCLFVNKPIVDISRELKNRDEKGVINGIKRAVYLREPFFKPG
ncbi:GTP 3',8-cyclase MoaA [Desulfurococcus amylolyticus]|uniref:Probable molybdenum cofactor biosynthesis protein A n=1 Tax=Desulfurococcus amylolyticus (strain DSM 18924 / JCM 16383 / VKM B-2413 / 1221n) TaxID=490899 RepID=B8D2Z3_DESA1|nr:GTP 3',8-cyclase MoaA [Desulfurococcus amylolyticus]ACL10540.1 Probable molybdenum cofactor biosynthesis protein A [Desulfurococcus amylolyticus 1221n]